MKLPVLSIMSRRAFLFSAATGAALGQSPSNGGSKEGVAEERGQEDKCCIIYGTITDLAVLPPEEKKKSGKRLAVSVKVKLLYGSAIKFEAVELQFSGIARVFGGMENVVGTDLVLRLTEEMNNPYSGSFEVWKLAGKSL